jgi:CDP-diacylglycerol--glycerol-3-phosphate 3-phosphatidyltransferase
VIDVACSIAIILAALLVACGYGIRVRRVGVARHWRVDRAGGSPLLGKGLMQMGYWAVGPISRACIAVGVTANNVSSTSLALGAGAGIALALGHDGVGAILGVVSFGCDALDGSIARASGTASEAGEVLDAAVDRYVELFFLGGIAFQLRRDPLGILLSLCAMSGAIMVSYATAKAEALQVQAPRGAMRRQERALYLALGAALSPLVALFSGGALPAWVSRLPLLLALALVGVVGNISAVRRLCAVARAVRRKTPATTGTPVHSVAGESSKSFAGDTHAVAGDGLR